MAQQITRRSVLGAIGGAAIGLGMARWLSAGQAPAARPNILFILADDMGYGDPRCYNPQSKVPTPNLDRLAREGMRFTDAHSGSAVCTPTRYGILTGRYCWRTRLKNGVLLGYDGPLIDAARPTVASLLRQQGYATACIGKWHVGFDWGRKDPAKPSSAENTDYDKPITMGPCDVGFDYFYGLAASLDMPPYIYIENDRLVGRPTAQGTAKEYLRAGAREPDFHAVDVLPKLTDKAVEYLEKHAKAGAAKPFFMYLALTAPHTPVAPAPSVKGRSQAGPYGDFVAQVDDTVGRVLQALDDQKLAENTLIIFTSDNGSTNKPMTEFDHLPNGQLRGRKSCIWDGGHRIPFLARWPGVTRPGSTCDTPICLADLFATSAEMTGATIPENAAEDSFSFLPLLKGAAAGPDRAIIHHSIDGMFAIRKGRWKLIEGRGSGGWEGKGKPTDPPGQLYDMQADVPESNNLYASRPEVVKELTGLLNQYRASGRSRPR